MTAPKCFPDEWQFINWVEADKVVKRSYGKNEGYTAFPCTNCTPSYAASMRMSDKCERPDVKFKYDENEGEFIGYDPAKLHQPLKLGRPPLPPRDLTPRVSIHKGVSWHIPKQKWHAKIYQGKKAISLGYFDDELEAAKEFQKAWSAKRRNKTGSTCVWGRNGRFVSFIQSQGKKIWVGTFDTITEAVDARDKRLIELGATA